MHFLVDLTCIYRLYSQVMPLSGSYQNFLMLVLLYNFLAFAVPALMGLLADLTDSSDTMAALGCVLTAVPVFISGAAVFTVVLQGLGNGLFHVGAGRRIIKDSEGKYAHSGIFISSGALGVFLGTYLRQQYSRIMMIGLACVLAFCAGVLMIFYMQQKKEKAADRIAGLQRTEDSFTQLKREQFLSVPALMILLVVFLRSFYGHAVSYDWKNTFLRSFLFVVCIAAGKAAGGITADRTGVRTASIISLGGAAVTVLFSEHVPPMGYLSIFLFNMTMPLTLGLIAGYWKIFPGFAFGSLMAALFLGTLPDLLLQGAFLPVQALCAVSLVSLLFLLLGIRSGEKGKKGET